MKKLLVVLVLAGIGMTGVLHAQKTHEGSHAFRNYTAIDGLPQSQVTSLLEDANGYLWMGTEGGGLGRFDGREFKIYSTLDGLLANFVTGLAHDEQNNLWILHPRGVTKFNGTSFKRFKAPGTSTTFKRQRKLFSSGDTIFVVAQDGLLSKIHGDSVYYWNRSVDANANIYSAFQSQGHLLFFISGGKLLLIKEGKRTYIETGFKEYQHVNFFDHKDEIWLNAKEGTFSVDLTNNKLVKKDFCLPHYVQYYDNHDDVFWSTMDGVIFKDRIQDNNLIQSDTVCKEVYSIDIISDSESNIWVASNGRGLFKYYQQDFSRCPSDKLGAVMAIHVDSEGSSWIGSMGGGLYKIKKGKVSSYFVDKETRKSMIHSIREDVNGTVWIGTAYGLGKYNAQKDDFEWMTKDDGLLDQNVMNINFDEKGGMWIGTTMGVDYFDGTGHKHYTTIQGLNANMIWAGTYLTKNRTYYVGTEFGLNSIKDGHIGIINVPELENTMVMSMGVYRDSLVVVGTGGAGVMIYNPHSNERKFITKREGLNSDFVYFVAEDKGSLWIGTERGISRIELNEKLEVTEHLYYDHDNGLTGIETNQNAYYIKDDTKYFGLVDGLYEFNDLSERETKSFDLHLTNVQLLYGEHEISKYAKGYSGFFRIPDNLSLPPDKNHITFNYNRVDKRYPKSVKFKYFLENFDKGWSQPSSGTEVTYSNLPPGDYVFKVMATNNKGSWSDDQISYAFTVKQPFYQTASFYAGVIIFLAGGITLLLYMRVRTRVRKMIEMERIRIREIENLRKEIARDFHDEMGNQLTRIINYISLMKLNNASHTNGNGLSNGSKYGSANGNGKDLYTKVEESAKYLYTGTRDFIWAIDPVNDELGKLFIHVRDFGEKLFEEKNISFRAFNEVKGHVKLPNGFSREANLIFKEAMTNSFKYSDAKNVKLSLSQKNESFEFVFEDDGIGFCTDHIKKTNGLRNIHERANRINTVLRISSEENIGTKVSLNFKLTKNVKHGITF